MTKKTDLNGYLLSVPLILFVLVSALLFLEGAAQSAADIMTNEERAWLANHPVIRIAPEHNYAPFIFVDTDGKPKGISADYLHLLEQKLGVRFQIQKGNNLATILDNIKQHETDVVTSLMRTPERSEHMLFTKPYVAVPAVIIVRKSIKEALTPEQIRTFRIAVGKGYAVQYYLQKKYSGVKLVLTNDDVQCLQKLSFGEVDAAVVDVASASYIIETQNITNLRVAGNTGFEYELSLASRKDWPMLNQILGKGIAQISEKEKEEIFKNWARLGHPAPLVSKTVWIIIAAFSGFILLSVVVIMAWNMSLRRMVRQKTDELKAIYDNAPIRMCVLDENRYVTYANQAFIDFADMSPDKLLGQHAGGALGCINALDDVRGCGFGKDCPNCALRLAMEDTLKTGAGHQNVEREITLLRDGYQKRVSLLGSTALIHAGDQNQLLLCLNDITERKQFEEALRQSEEKHRTILQTAMDGFCLVDLQGRIIDTNHAYCQMSGYSRQDLLGMTLADLEAVESPDMTAEHIRKTVERGQDRFETRHRRKDGQLFDIEASVQYQTSGDGHFVAFFRDITKRKLKEAELREGALRLQTVARAGNVGFWDWNLVTDEVFYSPEWKRQIGYEDHEISNNFGEWKTRVHPDDFDQTLRTIKAFIEKPWPNYNSEFRFRHRDGSYRWILTQASLTYNEQGIPVRMLGSHLDISERKQAETALRHSHDLMRYVIEHNRSAIAVHDRDMKYIYVSQRYLDDYKVKEKDVIGKHHYDVFPDLPQKWRDVHQRALAGEVSSAEDDPYEREDGSVDWTRWECRPWYEADGSVGGIIVYTEVITERKRVETELRQSEEKFRTLTESAPEAIFVQSGGRFKYTNNAMLKLLGASRPEELLGQDFMERIAPEYREAISDRIRIQIETGKPVPLMEQEYLRLDGSRIPVETTAVKIQYEGKEAHLVFVRDITDRKRAYAALEKMSKILSEGQKIAHMGTFEYVADTKTTMWSEEEYCIYGLDPAGPSPSYEVMLAKNIHPDDAALLNQTFTAAIKNSSTFEMEHRIVLPNGCVRWVYDCAHPQFDHSGKLTRYIGVTLDITGRKQAEEVRHQLEERLIRAEKMEALGTLAGGVAHDLNNVLGVVIAFAEILSDKIDESSPLRSYVKHIMDNSDRAAAIVDDLLTMARRGVQTEKVFNLNSTITDYQKTPEYQKLLTLHPHVHVETLLAPELLNIQGSPVHLSKTIMNLIINGMEAMPQGGHLTITTANQYLDRPLQGTDEINEGDYVVLAVSDTGEGINPEEMKRIFEPFYTKKSMGKSGTGLGLSVVWGTVKDHNGYIDVQSEVGHGSTFNLYFPVTRKETEKQAGLIPVSEYTGNGELILMVDDVYGQRELATQMLENLNYQVEAVSSGEDAIEYVKTKKPDLIVLDMIMDPGIDGLQTYSRILAIHPQQKAIIVSGYSETDKVKLAQELGAGAFVKKPYVSEKLGLAIRKELDKK